MEELGEQKGSGGGTLLLYQKREAFMWFSSVILFKLRQGANVRCLARYTSSGVSKKKTNYLALTWIRGQKQSTLVAYLVGGVLISC